MSLSSGTRLGPYEILAPLGAGGMGEVYRARDAKLGREVAVKVLPESVSADPERLARFEREARALASLNHPNIVTVYAVEEAGGVRLLAMELVEGNTLDLAIPAGGLPLSRFFEIAVPLADALSAAHERGIIHRDLKPGNVMLTREGRLKVLDFGLAKLVAAGSDPNATDLPTESRAQLTGEGAVFGTVAYMSPEQARGGNVDARSDVFALGVVLYEMLTGDRPFKGASSVDVISSILRDSPSSVTEIRGDLPPHVGRVLRRCLEKNPRDRYQTSRDVFNELRDLRAETSAPPSKTVAAPERRAPARVDSGQSRAEEGFRVAVLPFKHSGASGELAALTEGLTEGIVTGLSRFSYLRVIARSSTSQLASESADVRPAGKELGARYVMEGSLRQAGTRLRLAVQLVDATTGAHLWAENYERKFSPDSVFELQDDLVPRIVSTVADQNGVLTRRMSESLRGKSEDALTPHEAALRAFTYFERVTPEEHAVVRRILERAVRDAPDHADCWAMLSLMYSVEFADDFNPGPDPLDRALAAAQRAVSLAATHALGHYALAFVYCLRKETASFRAAAEKALALNPMDGSVMGILGVLLCSAGELERGCQMVEAAMQLNPSYPGLFRWAAFTKAYFQGQYAEALELAVRINMPNYFYAYAARAAALGQLGQREAAEKELRELLALRPDFATAARREYAKWYDSEWVEHMLDGLRKAGLEIPDDPTKLLSPAATTSGAARADEGFWVAVLPFKHGGNNADLAALAEGLTGDIVTGLSRFSYLRVIARGSTPKYSSEPGDPRAIGKELGARYVMEGSIRQTGTKLRLAVQLVDATSGAHLWAENYERTFRSDSVFELQDDLVPRIVSTVADMNGVLPRSMGEAVRSLAPDQMSPYEAVLRSFSYFERVTPEELAAARSGLEMAVRRAPGHADAWAMLALLCVQEYAQGFELQSDPLAKGATAARRAVETGPSNPLAHFGLAQALFFLKEFPGFRNAAERAVALNPMDGNSIAFLGELLTYAGEGKSGLALAARAKQLNPNHPGWYWYADFYDAYRGGDYHGALSVVLKANLPGHWGMHAAIAAASAQIGERDAAAKSLRDLLKLRPGFAGEVRTEFAKWWEPEYVESFLDGLRKAGLDISGPKQGAATHPAASDVVAIAVLPFSDMSPAKDQEYLCEGMAEEIMNALVRVDGIRVASRTSAFRARKESRDLPEIARLLSVSHVLEGSVRSSGARLRVTAQLTDVVTGYQLWSERFDRDTADVFVVQDEIAAGVVEAVRARLAPGPHVVPVRAQPPNLEAYRSYLKGRHLRGKEHLEGALRAFEEAIRLDPSHAPSWTGLAEATVLASVFGLIPARDACATARTALATAAQLQGESADGLHVEGFVAWIERRWDAMETAWRRAIDLQPTHVLSLASFGVVLCTRKRLDEALPFLERARQADPLSSFPYQLTGGGLLNCGKPQEALRFLEDALSFEKEDAAALDNAGQAQIVLGRVDEGIATLEHVVAVSRRGAHFLGSLGWALATTGRTEEARKILEELRARPKGSPAVVSEIWLLGALGEVDRAFEVVARAEEEHVAYLYFTGLPGFDPIRGDPRFGAFLERLGPSRP